MAEIGNELMKRMRHDLSELRMDLSGGKPESSVISGHMIGIQTNMHNICGMLARHDERLERTEQRLEPRELAEAQGPYEPK